MSVHNVNQTQQMVHIFDYNVERGIEQPSYDG